MSQQLKNRFGFFAVIDNLDFCLGFKVAADGCPNRRVLAKSNIDCLERNVLLAAQMPSAACQAEGRKTENETCLLYTSDAADD